MGGGIQVESGLEVTVAVMRLGNSGGPGVAVARPDRRARVELASARNTNLSSWKQKIELTPISMSVL